MASLSSSASPTKAMEKSVHHPQPLQCPRCSSSNTKFCYYNNYSLAQPRHFCKACKRYWTRGGTLRNVPVGGGCRKNKRVKRQDTTTSFDNGGDGISIAATVNPSTVQSSNLYPSRQIQYHVDNPSFCANPRGIKFPFSMFDSIRVSEFELGFSPRFGASDRFQQNNQNTGFDEIRNVAINASNSPILSSSGAINPLPSGSCSAFPSRSSAMASMLASTFQQGQNFRTVIGSHEDIQMQQRITSKEEVKNIEENNTTSLKWNQLSQQIEQANSFDHSYPVLWSTSGEWFDP